MPSFQRHPSQRSAPSSGGHLLMPEDQREDGMVREETGTRALCPAATWPSRENQKKQSRSMNENPRRAFSIFLWPPRAGAYKTSAMQIPRGTTPLVNPARHLSVNVARHSGKKAVEAASMSLALSRMLLDRFFPDAGAGDARPPMDWKETRDVHVFWMDVPGMSKDQVTVELVDGRILRVRGGKQRDDAEDGAAAGKGEEKEEREEKDQEEAGDGAVRWHCRERPAARAFETQFRLPDDASKDEVRAAMADGVLTVTVPKRKGGGGKKRHHGGNKPVCCRFWP